ncbi:MAG: rRNA pseudouridine synthase [Phycisphaerales bacterium]|nr:rRNA pseudouridine synthase [Phycisphaerales bacterium]
MSDDFRDASRGERLQKVLARAGVGSRRECETLIESGVVSVNGHVLVELPVWVDPAHDRITVSGRPIRPSEQHVYIMLNKPKETISTNDDPAGRRRAIDLIDHPDRPRLFPVGRLDKDTTGLLLLTNDGELANHLTHPRYGVHKTYHALVRGDLNEEAVADLERGIFLAERRKGGARRAKAVRFKLLRRDRGKTLIEVTLREGRNRQVRRMMLRVGCPVKKLRRIRLGPLALKGLAVGQWRELTSREVRALRRAADAGEKP